MAICWRCGVNFMQHPVTGNCLICGYEQDIDHVEDVKAQKAIHDFLERNPQSDGGSKDYKTRRKNKACNIKKRAK